jgi:hypothetical protein
LPEPSEMARLTLICMAKLQSAQEVHYPATGFEVRLHMLATAHPTT